MGSENFSATDYRFMARALELAHQGRYSTQPNPRVGCVLVSQGEVVGEAYHQKAGEPHAEVLALRMAGERAKGATAYVTLEPCSHRGRTPPCCDALIAAGLARVIYSLDDANPEVAGSGAAKLREADIAVSAGLMAGESKALNRGFFKRHEHGMPFVTVKLATSLDAKIGLKTGESKWITGPDARADVQRMRAQSCAVITGSGTIRADNPRLNVRDQSLQTRGRQPLIVVLDSGLSLTSEYEIFKNPESCLIMHCAEQRKAAHNARCEQIKGRSGEIDLHEVLVTLSRLQCNEVMVEAGPSLASAFIASGLWDELVLFIAPKFIGSNGRDGFPLPSISDLSYATDVEIANVRHVGSDLRLTLTQK